MARGEGGSRGIFSKMSGAVFSSKEEVRTLALFESFWPLEFGDPVQFLAAKLTNLPCKR